MNLLSAKTKKWVLACLVVSTVFGSASASTGTDIHIAIAILDANETRAIDSKVVIQAGETDQTLQRDVSGRYVFKTSLQPTISSLNIQLTPANGYQGRSIPIIISKLPMNKATSYDFYVATKAIPVPLNYDYLLQGIKYHRQEFDRAFAYYDVAHANHRDDIQTQLDINLKYNYAVSVANTCLRLHYVTCDQAQTLYQELKSAFDRYKSFFQAEHLDLAMLDTALDHLSTAKINMEYKAATVLYATRNYEGAANASKVLLEKFDDNPESFAQARLTRDRLREDIGLAYVKASRQIKTDASSGANSDELLNKAHKYYSEINTKTPKVLRDIEYVKQQKNAAVP